MYITYKKSIQYPHKIDVPVGTKELFKDWVSYIDNFLKLIKNIKLNCRQLDMLCLRLSLALDIIGNEVKIPDYLMCVILKDMLKNIKPERDRYSDVCFSYIDKNTKKVEHIFRLFFDGEIEDKVETCKFVKETNDKLWLKTNIHKYSNVAVLKANEKAAKYAILANIQSKNIQSNQ